MRTAQHPTLRSAPTILLAPARRRPLVLSALLDCICGGAAGEMSFLVRPVDCLVRSNGISYVIYDVNSAPLSPSRQPVPSRLFLW